jgi:TonB family protein
LSLIYKALKLAQETKLARETFKAGSPISSPSEPLLKLQNTVSLPEESQRAATFYRGEPQAARALDPQPDEAIKLTATNIGPLPAQIGNNKIARAPRAWLACQVEKFRQPTVRWMPACVAIGALLGAGLSPLRRTQIAHAFPTNAEPPPELLGLTLERHKADWQVSWNRNAAVVLQATRGRLFITDGAIHKELDLDRSELRTGHVVYAALTDNLFLRLEIVGRDSANPITESVRLVTAKAPPILLSHKGAVDTRPGERSGVKWITTSESEAPGGGGSKSAAAQPPRPAAQLPRPAAQPASPMSSPAKAGESTNTGKPKAQSSTEPFESAEKVAIATSLATSDSGGAEQPGAFPVPSPAAQGDKIESPERIVGRNPAYPLIARRSHITGSVEVRFRVSAAGTVYDVTVVKGSPLLIRAAVEAVETWRYKPAELNGTPIDAEVTNIFDFQPE